MFRLLLITVFFWSFDLSQSKAEDDLSSVQVITSFYEPYSFVKDEVAQGAAVEQAHKIFKALGFNPTIKVYPWARAYTTALNSPNTVIFSMARTPEREDKFHWIGEIIGFDVYLYKDKKRDDIQINQLSDAAEFIVGALNKDVKGNYLRKHKLNVTSITNEETGIDMILSGRLELLPTDATSMKHRLKKLGYAPDALQPVFHLKGISRPLYIALSKDTGPEIVEAFRKAYKKSFPKP